MALNNLNSKDKITAKKGLDSMKVLAKDYKYQDALKELGITYYPHVKVQSSQIKNRRGVLGLDSKESEKISIDYLEDIAEDSASADVLYILGYNYWRHQNWEKGINTLSKAKDMLQKSSSKTMNGKPKEELLKFEDNDGEEDVDFKRAYVDGKIDDTYELFVNSVSLKIGE